MAEKPEKPEQLAAELTRRLFELGGTCGKECNRIQFMSGMWPDNEDAMGGMCKKAMERWFRDQLKDLTNG